MTLLPWNSKINALEVLPMNSINAHLFLREFLKHSTSRFLFPCFANPTTSLIPDDNVRMDPTMEDNRSMDFIRGSLQKFVPNAESCEDYGPNLFSTEDVHRIGILDLRILNCDRHTGNLLFDFSE